MSPPADYLEAVYFPALNRTGAEGGCRMERAGFFPKGGGEVEIHVGDGHLTTPIEMVERGRLTLLRLFLVTCDLPDHVATRASDTLLKELRGYGVPVSVEPRALKGGCQGAAVVLVAECENGLGGWTSLGERGKPVERVATEALKEFKKWFSSSAAVDEHLADQLVLPCALADGVSRWTTPIVTDHLRTVVDIVKRFVSAEIEIDERPDGSGLVTVKTEHGRFCQSWTRV